MSSEDEASEDEWTTVVSREYRLTDAEDETIPGEVYDDPNDALDARARLMASHEDGDDVTVEEQTRTTADVPRSGKFICNGCGKVVSSDSLPFGPCEDCDGDFRPATSEDLACDECGADDAHSVFGENRRLCDDCLDEERDDDE